MFSANSHLEIAEKKSHERKQKQAYKTVAVPSAHTKTANSIPLTWKICLNEIVEMLIKKFITFPLWALIRKMVTRAKCSAASVTHIFVSPWFALSTLNAQCDLYTVFLFVQSMLFPHSQLFSLSYFLLHQLLLLLLCLYPCRL